MLPTNTSIKYKKMPYGATKQILLFLIMIFSNSLIILIFCTGGKICSLCPPPFLVFYSKLYLLVYVKNSNSLAQGCTCLKNILRAKYSEAKMNGKIVWISSALKTFTCKFSWGEKADTRNFPTKIEEQFCLSVFIIICLAFVHLLIAHSLKWRLFDSIWTWQH